MSVVVAPTDEQELAGFLLTCNGDLQPVEIIGGGSKRGVHGSIGPFDRLELSAIRGVVDYDPSELVLTVRAGTPLADISSLLAESGQMLGFEAVSMAELTGDVSAISTIGGVVSANQAGPRRVQVGAARDHFLGFRGVSGRGEVFKAGGRVVKNVTGFDLPKVLSGAWGTLAVISELSIRVVPRPRTTMTLLLSGLDVTRACEAMTLALAAPGGVSGAAHLSRNAAFSSSLRWDSTATVLRVEGIHESVVARVRNLRRTMVPFGEAIQVDAEMSNELWTEIASVGRLLPANGKVWRLTALPSELSAYLSRTPVDDWLLDWGGQLLWLRSADPPQAPVGTNIQCWRRPNIHEGDVVSPIGPDQLKIMQCLKSYFDPNNVLNPGRLLPVRH